MAIDEPIQRGTPAGDSHSARTKMGQKMALVHQRLSLLDSSTRHVDDDDDGFKLTGEQIAIVVPQQSKTVDDCDDPDGEVDFVLLRRKRETPADDSQSAMNEMGQKMPLVHQRVSLLDRSGRHIDHDDDFGPTGEELAIGLGHSMPVDDCNGPDGEIDYPPLRLVPPDSMENGQEKCPGLRYKQGAKKTTTCFTKTYKRKRGRPEGSKSAKRNMEQKPALFDSSSSSHSGRKSDKDDDLEPSDEDGNFEPSDKDGDFEPSDKDGDFEPTRKRRRPAGFKSGKSKKSRLVDSSSSTEGKKDKDGDFEPEVSDDDGKKYARVKDFYGTACDTAVKVNEKLPAEGPSFVKLMLKSHVVRGFWLGLPVSFCRNYLPEHDVTIELEDEDGNSYDTNYLANKKGLSSGWNGFAQQHDLKVSDAVVFQLVGPTRFKVYILRENKFTTTDGALSLLSLDASKENNTSKKDSSNDEFKSKEDPEVTGQLSSKPCDDDSNNLASEEATDDDIIRSSDIDTGFAAVKSFRNFKIIVNGSVISRRLLPGRVRRMYFKLCCERKAFLHRNLLKRINPTLAAEVIVETANIAEGIRAFPASASASASSLEEDLAAWKKILESFELMGMDVGFMRKRVDDLIALLTAQPMSRDLQLAAEEECEGYEKVKLERDSAAEKMRALESRMSSLRDAVKEMDMEMKEMVESSARKKREQAMRKLAAAPW